MPMKQWGNAYRTTVVCVDSYDEHVLRGRLYRAQGILLLAVYGAFCVAQFLL